MTSKPKKQKFPSRIVKMIRTARSKGWNATRTTSHVNDSLTAMNLDVSYTIPQIAAKMAHITMGR